MSRLSPGKTVLLLILVIALIIVGMHFSAENTNQSTYLDSAVRIVLSPVQGFFTGISDWISDTAAIPSRLYQVDQKNQELQAQVAELQGKLTEYNEIKNENERLQEQLNFKVSTGGEVTIESAAVVAREADNWFAIAVINKGTNSGIQQDMAVITPSGLVGRITSVTEHTAEVLLITDPRSGVGSLVQKNRAPGIVEGITGSRGVVHMVHIESELTPEKDDIVVTSGYGSVFPKGIPVGTVLETRREESGMFHMAVLQTAVDFNRLEEVMVIIQP